MSRIERSVRRVLLLGSDSEAGQGVQLAVGLRWPDAAVALGEDPKVIFQEEPDLVLMQAPVNLNALVGIIRDIRKDWPDLPLIVLGTRHGTGEAEEARVLEAGADDYIRPSAPMVDLLARMAAVLRRSWRGRTFPPIRVESGPVLLDLATRAVMVNGRPVSLTKTEFRLLQVLMENEDSVVTHRFLETTVWNDGVDSLALIKTYMKRLRQKLGDHAEGSRFIRSVRGVGYRFVGATNHIEHPLADQVPA